MAKREAVLYDDMEWFYVYLDQFVPVKGIRITIPGFEEFSLFAYRDKRLWSVCEQTTGRVIETQGQLDQAVNDAAISIAKAGKEKLRELMETAIAEKGEAPKQKKEIER